MRKRCSGSALFRLACTGPVASHGPVKKAWVSVAVVFLVVVVCIQSWLLLKRDTLPGHAAAERSAESASALAAQERDNVDGIDGKAGAGSGSERAKDRIIDTLGAGFLVIDDDLRLTAKRVALDVEWVALMERGLIDARTSGEVEVFKRRVAEADASLEEAEKRWKLLITAPIVRADDWRQWKGEIEFALEEYRIHLHSGMALNHPSIVSIDAKIDAMLGSMPEAPDVHEIEAMARSHYNDAPPERVREWEKSAQEDP